MKWLAYTIGVGFTLLFTAWTVGIAVSPDVIGETCSRTSTQSYAMFTGLAAIIAGVITALAAWDDHR